MEKQEDELDNTRSSSVTHCCRSVQEGGQLGKTAWEFFTVRSIQLQLDVSDKGLYQDYNYQLGCNSFGRIDCTVKLQYKTQIGSTGITLPPKY